MQKDWYAALTAMLAVFTLLSVPLAAEEPYRDFLQGLRNRDWHDAALWYLEEISRRPDLPVELRDILPFEKARSRIDAASQLRDLEKRQEYLAEARRLLEHFLESHPEHPRSSEARAQFGMLLLERGRLAVLHAEHPVHQARRRDLQNQARDDLRQAREVLQKALAQYEAQYKSFPINIDAHKQKAQYESREGARTQYLQTLIDLAILEYEIARSYDPDDPQRSKVLALAADQFQKIHKDFRTFGVGLYARLYQGKCLAEMGEGRKALGIFDELLAHDPRSPEQTPQSRELLVRVQHRARLFRLMTLNHPSQKDYQHVVDEAERWLRENSSLRRNDIGLAIQWELARALEKLAEAEADESPAQQRWFRRAYAAADPVARSPNQHRTDALAMIARLRGHIAELTVEPRTFSDAYDLAQGALTRAEQTAQIDQATGRLSQNQEAEHLSGQLRHQWQEAARQFRRALELAGPDDSIEEVNRARVHLSYAYYQFGRSFDAAILAEYVARRYPKSDTARRAAFFALAAYVQAYNARPQSDANFEIEQMTQAGTYLVENWPRSAQADEARLILGNLYNQRGDPTTAAQWYNQVADASEKFLEARQKAGMAYWSAYLKASAQPKESRLAPEQLQEHEQKAKQFLESGIEQARQRLIAGQTPPATLIRAELTLAQIAAHSGDYQKALGLLVRDDGPGLLEMVESQASGGAQDASLLVPTYATALQAYIGAGDMDSAQDLFHRLEAFDQGSGSLVRVYRQLGQQLQEQIRQRREQGDHQRLKQMRETFEGFLDRLLQQDREQPLSFETLYWVAEAYYQFGENQQGETTSTVAPSADGREYFARAAEALQRILQREQNDPDYIPAAENGSIDPSDVIRLRLATCQRKEGTAEACEKAYPLLLAVLTRTPTSQALQPQIEAAYLFQTWARHEPQRWDHAIAGIKGQYGDQPFQIWGWGRIAQLLERSPSARPGRPYYETYFEARYNLNYCRYQKALTKSGSAEAKQLLADAERDIALTARLRPELGGLQWQQRLDSLLRQIQKAQGKPVTGLETLPAQPQAVSASRPR